MPDPFSPSAQPKSAAQGFPAWQAPMIQQICLTCHCKLPLAPLRCSELRLAKSHCLPQKDSEQERYMCHQEKPRERNSRVGSGGLLPAPMYPTRRLLLSECHHIHLSCGMGRVDGLGMREMQEWEELMLTNYFPPTTITSYWRHLKGGRGTHISSMRIQKLRIICRVPISKQDSLCPRSGTSFPSRTSRESME